MKKEAAIKTGFTYAIIAGAFATGAGSALSIFTKVDDMVTRLVTKTGTFF